SGATHGANAKSAQTVIKTCQKFKVDVYAMMAQAGFQGLNAAQNNQCAKQLSSLSNTPLPTYTPITFATPSVSCDDPNNQSLTCFCQRPANATSPICKGFTPGPVAGGGASTSGGPTAGTVSPYSPNGDLAGTAGDEFNPGAGAAKAGGAGGKEPGDGGSGA